MDEYALRKLSDAAKSILEAIGDDTGREGLKDTPERVAKMFLEVTSGLRESEPKITTFSSEGHDQMITVLGLGYWSLCEHHLAPFFGKVHIGYLPGKKLAGLSKFGRVADFFAKRPQIQENMTSQIADFINAKIEPKGLIVVVEGTHLCMSMRGVKKPDHLTITSAIRGNIPKQEFFDLLQLRR